MKAICPDCSGDVEINVIHQGRTSDGRMERVVIEAVHGGDPCEGWTAASDRTHDLVALAASAKE